MFSIQRTKSHAYHSNRINIKIHQLKTFPSGRNGCVRVEALCQSRQRHPVGRLLRARRQDNASRCISPSEHCFAVSSRSVRLLFKPTLWHYGQLWPYVGMGSLGTSFHRDCNAMGDAAKISPHVPSTSSSRSLGRRWEDMILPGREDPLNRWLSEWHQMLGKIECEFSLNDKRGWKCDDVYLLRGLLNIYSPSPCPAIVPLCPHTTAIAPWRCSWSSVCEMDLEIEIEWTQRCTWGPWLSQFGYTLGDWDRVNSEMRLEAVLERLWRCTCRQ